MGETSSMTKFNKENKAALSALGIAKGLMRRLKFWSIRKYSLFDFKATSSAGANERLVIRRFAQIDPIMTLFTS